MSSALCAAIFDFDGTIAETERCGHRVAYNAAFTDLQLPWRWDEAAYAALLATPGGKERLEGFIARERPGLEPAERERLVVQIHARKNERFEALAGTIPVRPGILRFALEARAAGVRLAVATTASRRGVDALLAHHPGLAACFETIVAGDDVARKKPAPDAYIEARERLGCSADECLAFEDSEAGLQSARAARIRTLITPSVYGGDRNFAGAAAVLSDLGEPERPARVLAGPAPPLGFVDVAFASQLLAA